MRQSSLVTFGHALLGARRPAPPAVQRPAATPRFPAAASQAKQAAGARVVAAGKALLVAKAEADAARRNHLAACVDGRLQHGSFNERRLAKRGAERRAEQAVLTLQARQAEYEAAVRAFYAA